MLRIDEDFGEKRNFVNSSLDEVHEKKIAGFMIAPSKRCQSLAKFRGAMKSRKR